MVTSSKSFGTSDFGGTRTCEFRRVARAEAEAGAHRPLCQCSPQWHGGRHMGMGFALNDLEVDQARLCQARVCFRVPPACQR